MADPVGADPAGKVSDPGQVPVAYLAEHTPLDQAFLGELAQCLQLPIPGAQLRRRRRHHRAGHEAVHDVENVVFVAAGHGDQPVEVGAVGEHRHPVEQVALVGVEQVVRPGHRGVQGAMPLHARTAASQQAEPVMEETIDLGQRHRPATRRPQLDGQRDAIQTGADPAGEDALAVADRQIRSGRHRPNREQLQGVVVRQ